MTSPPTSGHGKRNAVAGCKCAWCAWRRARVARAVGRYRAANRSVVQERERSRRKSSAVRDIENAYWRRRYADDEEFREGRKLDARLRYFSKKKGRRDT